MLRFSALILLIGLALTGLKSSLSLPTAAAPIEITPEVLGENTQSPPPPPCTPPTKLDVLVDKFNALPASYIPPDLVNVDNFKMRAEAAIYLETMFNEMASQRLYPKINSAYRTYDDQDYINVGDNMKSAPPGHSEHQLGTAVDLTLTDPAWNWLDLNAHRFGFVMSYRANQTTLTGYRYEPWHWRYVGTDLATRIRHSENIPQSFYRTITCQ